MKKSAKIISSILMTFGFLLFVFLAFALFIYFPNDKSKSRVKPKRRPPVSSKIVAKKSNKKVTTKPKIKTVPIAKKNIHVTTKADIAKRPIPKVAKPNPVPIKRPRPAYDPAGRTDIFAPIFLKGTYPDRKSKALSRRPRTPLERVDLSQMSLKGIILSENGNIAMIEDTFGKSYVIEEGTHIGINEGKVIKILPNRVVVEEYVANILGREVLKKKELKFKATYH